MMHIRFCRREFSCMGPGNEESGAWWPCAGTCLHFRHQNASFRAKAKSYNGSSGWVGFWFLEQCIERGLNEAKESASLETMASTNLTHQHQSTVF